MPIQKLPSHIPATRWCLLAKFAKFACSQSPSASSFGKVVKNEDELCHLVMTDTARSFKESKQSRVYGQKNIAEKNKGQNELWSQKVAGWMQVDFKQLHRFSSIL